MKKPRNSRSVSSLKDGWTGRFSTKPLSHKWGYCDYVKKEIVIGPDTVAEGCEREVIIHEMLHKLFPWMREFMVTAAALEIDYALTQLLPEEQ